MKRLQIILLLSIGALRAADAPTIPPAPKLMPYAPIPDAQVARLSRLRNAWETAEKIAEARKAAYKAGVEQAIAPLKWPLGSWPDDDWQCVIQTGPQRVEPCAPKEAK